MTQVVVLEPFSVGGVTQAVNATIEIDESLAALMVTARKARRVAAASFPQGTQPLMVTGAEERAIRSLVSGDGETGLSALQALGQAATRRVDLVMIGDSNQAFGGHGFSVGLERALLERFACYATGIYGGGGGVATYVSSALNATNVANDGSSVPICDFSVLGGAVRYGYLSSSTFSSNTGGLAVSAANGFPVSAQLRAWWAYGVDDSFVGGSFNAGVRRSDSPYTSIGTVGSASTTAETGRDGLRILRLTMAADAARTYPLECRWQLPSAGVTGPFVSYYNRLEVATATAGISCHTMISAGGQSAWDFAYYLQSSSDRSLTIWFAEVRRLQLALNQSPIVVVYINTGVNDRNETNTPSLGPARVADTGDSAAEYVDNVRACQQRIEQIWESNGWPVGELHWLIVPSHRISDPDDADLVAYRAAAQAAMGAEAQTSVVDLGGLMSAASATAGGWYDGGGPAHLTTTGYLAVARLIVGQVP